MRAVLDWILTVHLIGWQLSTHWYKLTCEALTVGPWWGGCCQIPPVKLSLHFGCWTWAAWRAAEGRLGFQPCSSARRCSREWCSGGTAEFCSTQWITYMFFYCRLAYTVLLLTLWVKLAVEKQASVIWNLLCCTIFEINSVRHHLYCCLIWQLVKMYHSNHILH